MSKVDDLVKKGCTTFFKGRHTIQNKRETRIVKEIKKYIRAFRLVVMEEDKTISQMDTQTFLHSSFIPIVLTVSMRIKYILSTSIEMVRTAFIRHQIHTSFWEGIPLFVYYCTAQKHKFAILLRII